MNASLRTLLKLLAGVFGIAVLLGMGLTSLGINPLGFGTLEGPRTAFCFAYWGILVLLFVPRLHEFQAPILILLPVLTQFNNVVMGWDLPIGGYAPIRLLPYLLASAIMAWSLRGGLWKDIHDNLWLVGSLCLLGVLGAAGGWANDAPLWAPALLFYSLYLPLWALYLRRELSEHGSKTMKDAAFMAGAIGIFATLVVIVIGSQLNLGGKEGIAGSRNVSDINIVLPYLLLLWPFVTLGMRRLGPVVSGALMAGLIGVAFLGLSRVGMVLIPLLLVGTLLVAFRHRRRLAVGSLAVMLCLGTGVFLASTDLQLAGQVLARRFNITESQDIGGLAAQFSPGGTESLQRDLLRSEAFRMVAAEPLWGVGIGNFGENSRVGFGDAHSLTFAVMAEFGLVGVACLYVVLGSLVLCLIHAWQKTRSPVVVLFAGSGACWYVMAHTVGSNLVNLSLASFGINAATGAYLLLFLFVKEWSEPT